MMWGTVWLAAALCYGLAYGQTLEELQQLQELFEQAVAAGTTQKPGSGGQVPGSGGQFPGSGGQVPGSGGQFPGSGGQFPGSGGQVPGRPTTPPVTSRPPPPPGQGSSSGSQGCKYFCRNPYGRYVPCC